MSWQVGWEGSDVVTLSPYPKVLMLLLFLGSTFGCVQTGIRINSGPQWLVYRNGATG